MLRTAFFHACESSTTFPCLPAYWNFSGLSFLRISSGDVLLVSFVYRTNLSSICFVCALVALVASSLLCSDSAASFHFHRKKRHHKNTNMMNTSPATGPYCTKSQPLLLSSVYAMVLSSCLPASTTTPNLSSPPPFCTFSNLPSIARSSLPSAPNCHLYTANPQYSSSSPASHL